VKKVKDRPGQNLTGEGRGRKSKILSCPEKDEHRLSGEQTSTRGKRDSSLARGVSDEKMNRGIRSKLSCGRVDSERAISRGVKRETFRKSRERKNAT